ncbi:MAG: TldD/PmbA family protein [Clostridia bacterium]|nr:TldD/PmbA family protein [Clostridia bacterium]
MNAFLNQLMARAKEAGIEACEAYIVERDSFKAMVTGGEVVEYNTNATRGLGFRGIKDGKMGYASTEAFDDDAVEMLVRGVVESAELSEDTDPVFLYDGSEDVPELTLTNDEIAQLDPEVKIARVIEMEKAVKAYDERIDKTARNMVQTGRHTVRIVNSYGMDRAFTEDICVMYGQATAKENGHVATGFYGKGGRSFDLLDAQKIGSEVGKSAVEQLGATQIPTGSYRVIIHRGAMTDLLETFCGIFSAETAHKGLSLLKGRVGEKIAADGVSIIDDPLLLAGLEARPFDAEGVPSKAHTLVENGVFKTFLHNLKTAHKDGVETTGNASKAGYSSAVHVSPSNLYIKAGNKSFDELVAEMGDGVVITDVAGLHAGANPVSGDFSLLSKGYTVRNGKKEKPIEQITVAGNFYDLLRNARSMADDLEFPFGGIGSPSIDVGEISISGC